MTVTQIATQAEDAVRADYRAGIIAKGPEAYEAAQAELTVRAEDAGMTLTGLALKTTAAQVAAKATA